MSIVAPRRVLTRGTAGSWKRPRPPQGTGAASKVDGTPSYGAACRWEVSSGLVDLVAEHLLGSRGKLG